MGMSTGGGGSVKAEPNVTPLVDVMLVLLIIFMVIIPTLTSGLNATPPQGSTKCTGWRPASFHVAAKRLAGTLVQLLMEIALYVRP